MAGDKEKFHNRTFKYVRLTLFSIHHTVTTVIDNNVNDSHMSRFRMAHTICYTPYVTKHTSYVSKVYLIQAKPQEVHWTPYCLCSSLVLSCM